MMGSTYNTSNSGGRKWKHIFDHQGKLQKFCGTKKYSRNHYLTDSTLIALATEMQSNMPYSIVNSFFV